MEQGQPGLNAAPLATGGNLAVAVDRLDKALAALESRVRALQAGEPVPAYDGPADGVRHDDYQKLLEELDVARAHNAELAMAAESAYAALGAAASDIRQLLGEEAA
ncbi:MAG: hypothetical protein ACTHLA_04630 [Asticcacaulis sp.]|uniref:hypothetical protein n=1 Tax=Asticcacaulis sp. TaxID=1872648 RepID=UPI003F7C7DAD